MRILLDTSYLYRLMMQPGHLSDAERLILTNQTLHIYVSAVSTWEMRLKFQSFERSGKRKSLFDPNVVLNLSTCPCSGRRLLVIRLTRRQIRTDTIIAGITS